MTTLYRLTIDSNISLQEILEEHMTAIKVLTSNETPGQLLHGAYRRVIFKYVSNVRAEFPSFNLASDVSEFLDPCILQTTDEMDLVQFKLKYGDHILATQVIVL